MLPTAQAVLSDPPDGKADYICALTYEERFLRRRKLTTDCGTSFVVDLEIILSYRMEKRLKFRREANP
jgi:hypothetical protein